MTKVTLDERVECVIRSEVNQRPNNEDSVQVLTIPAQGQDSALYLLTIADGMGGHAHGEDVSAEGLRKVSLNLFDELVVTPSINPSIPASPRTSEQIQGAIQSAIDQANRFLNRMITNNNWGTAGATLVLALIGYDRAWVANLGDSPLFHWQVKTGELSQITEDHTITNALVKGGQLSAEMAEHHAYKNVLELYLGCEDLPDPLPFYEVPLQVGDRLLLCSDGVSGDLSLTEIKEILSLPDTLETIADRLIQASLAAETTDNQTLILWEHPAHARHQNATVMEKLPSETPLSQATLIQPQSTPQS